MDKTNIPVSHLALDPFTTFSPNGILLVSGHDTTRANPMTISWGMFGIMWGRPVMMVMVRPTRYTWKFITQSPDFTVNWMPEDWTDAVRLCGSASGRDQQKFAATGMNPVAATQVQSPVIAESMLSLECRTLYRHDIAPDQFLDASLMELYRQQDFHGLFFGEIVAACGIGKFHRA